MTDQPREIPILFSGPMIGPILADTKTQTRRLCKSMNGWIDQDCREVRLHKGHWCHFLKGATMPLEKIPLRWRPGDRLWVRETFSGPHWCEELKMPPGSWHYETPIWYWADGAPPNKEDWTKPKPSMFMPRFASRITLDVTNVRVEQLNDITEADARAEGISDGGCLNCGNPEPSSGKPNPCECAAPQPDARDAYAGLWDRINGNGSWHTNPWVVPIDFKRVLEGKSNG